MMELSVVVPIYNEADGMQAFYDRITPVLKSITNSYEIIYVNDGSNDGSMNEIRELSRNDSHVFYINFSRNFGHQIAVMAGLDKCRGKVVVIIDGDLQDPPELISELYQKYLEGFEVVYAQREKRKGESQLKKFTSAAFYRVMKKITHFDIPVDTGDYRLIDQKVVKYLRKMPEKTKYLRGQIAWLGFRQTRVMFNRDAREFGTSGYSYAKLMKLAMDGITGFSDKPLILVSRLGIFISMIAVIIIMYAIFSHFVLNHEITGWTSLIVSSMFIGGVQLISIGIIGEYISRINLNVINRPLYIVNDTNLEAPTDNE